MKKLVMVECISSFRNRYVVEVEDEIDHALDEVIMRESDEDFTEFSQEYMGMMTISHREITREEYLKTFDKDNAYLKDWPEEKKLAFINKADYDEVINGTEPLDAGC